MLDRRNFLKTTLAGAGAAAVTPYGNLKAAVAAEKGTPRRFVFIRKCNGIIPRELSLPSFPNALKQKDKKKEAFEASLKQHELPQWLKQLEPYKDHMTILQGLSSKMSENGHWSHQSVMGAFKSHMGSISAIKRATVDFELGFLFPSPLTHVELSLAIGEGVKPGFSAPGPHQKNYAYGDAITAYNKLFKCVLDPDSLKSDTDMLEYLHAKELKQSRSFSKKDKQSYQAHVKGIENLRIKNQKLAAMSDHIAKFMPERERIHDLGKPGGPTPKTQEAMTEVLVSALITGMTHVVTYNMDSIGNILSGLPSIENEAVNMHNLGHNQSYGGKKAPKVRDIVHTQHVKQIKTIIDRLKAQPEGDGNMFDNTMIMYFPEGGEAHHGHGTESPWVIMAGKNCRLDFAGKYIRLPYHATQGHQTLGNWYTTLLNAYGNPIEHYGDPDPEMFLKKLPQEGPIKEFMKKG